jgi:DNA gyrase subunit A
MVVADPDATLLTVCEKGYGKRTNFGPNDADAAGSPEPGAGEAEPAVGEDDAGPETLDAGPAAEEAADEEGAEGPSGQRYRTQRRGGKGLRDIKTTERNGPVIGVVRVDDRDEVLMMTARGKLQRIAAADISVIGRNTQGVRIMSLDEGDSLVAVVRVPPDEDEGPPAIAAPATA